MTFDYRVSRFGFFLGLALAFVSVCSVAENVGVTNDSKVLELQSTIVGSQEQPEVIYIVPWKQIEAPAPNYEPMQNLVNSQFDLLDRDEWRRRIDLQKIIDASASQASESVATN